MDGSGLASRSALAPLFIKKGYGDDPCFKNAKVVSSLYDETFSKPFNHGFADKLRFDGIGDPEIENVKQRGAMDYQSLMKLAIDFSDGIILGSEKIDPQITSYIREGKIDFLPYNADFDKNVDDIDAFYEKIDA